MLMASRVTGISLAPTVNRSLLLLPQIIVIGRRLMSWKRFSGRAASSIDVNQQGTVRPDYYIPCAEIEKWNSGRCDLDPDTRKESLTIKTRRYDMRAFFSYLQHRINRDYSLSISVLNYILLRYLILSIKMASLSLKLINLYLEQWRKREKYTYLPLLEKK